MTLANVALSSAGATISGSKTWWNGGAGLIIDGNLENYTYTDDAAIPANWIKIDLNQTIYCSTFRVKQGSDSRDQVYTYDLEYSLNGTDWTTKERHTSTGQDDSWEVAPVEARYWRITPVTGGTWPWYMMEWEIWGDADYEPPTLSDCDPPTPTAGELTDWLTLLDADYVPTIEAYLSGS